MDLVAVVSTDRDVWQLKVRGQLMNETWSNIGIRWEPYDESRVRIFSSILIHIWLVGCPNPYKMEQSWECTFLRLFTHTNPKSASKMIFIIGLKNY